MDPHLLRTFVTVARLGSFSEAAEELGYTQSAVSQHIASLEQDLGARLLERRPVVPTPVGARLLEHATPLLLRLDAARADITRLVSAPSGRAKLAMTPLSASLSALSKAWHPGQEFTVDVLTRDEAVTAVATGTADLALVDGIAAPSDPLPLPDLGPLSSVSVGEDQVSVLLPPDHPLCLRGGVRLGDLADARWIDAPDASVPLQALRRAGADGFRPALRYNGCDVLTLITLVTSGHGLAVLPRRLTAGLPSVLLSHPPLVHRTELLRAAALSTAALTIAEVLLRAQ